MNEFEISTIETRQFRSPQIAVPFEVQSEDNGKVIEGLSSFLGEPVIHRELEAEHILRLVSRIAVTGEILPPFSVNRPFGTISLNTRDVFRLGLDLSRFERFPTSRESQEGSEYSEYLAVRQRVEEILELKHIDLEIREGKRRDQEEERISAFSKTIANYQISHARSPELGFETFVQLLKNNKGVFAFPASGNMLLGASALGAAYQIAIMANPVLAIQLATGGGVAYVILRFGAAMGQEMGRFFR